MAMMITLRTRNGADVLTAQEIGPLNAYPDVVNYDSAVYILKRVMPDKQNALYYEANVFDLAAPEGQKHG